MQEVWTYLKTAQRGAADVDLWDAFADVSQHLGKWPQYKRSKSDPSALSVVDMGNLSRVRMMLDLWEVSGDVRFSDVVLAFAQNPPGGWNSWSYAGLAETVAGLRDGDYGNIPCKNALADVLENSLINGLDGWLASDDLGKAVEAIELAQASLNPLVFAALNTAIQNEFSEIRERTEDMDSESTLNEHLKLLQKLAPKAGISASELQDARDVVKDRIVEIESEADTAVSPGLRARPE